MLFDAKIFLPEISILLELIWTEVDRICQAQNVVVLTLIKVLSKICSRQHSIFIFRRK